MSLRTPPPITLAGHNLVVTTSPKGNLSPVLQGVLVHSSSANARWLQVHVGSSVPSNGVVPKALLYVAAGTKNVSLALPTGLPIDKNGLVLVMSSTEATLTIDTANEWTIIALIDEYERQDGSDTTVTGDLTTGVANKQVWADSAGPKRLRRLQVKNNNAAVRYACIYAVDSPGATSKIIAYETIPGSGNIDMDFGDGLSPIQLDSDGTIHDGCTVIGQDSLTPGDQAAGTDFNIRATYI